MLLIITNVLLFNKNDWKIVPSMILALKFFYTTYYSLIVDDRTKILRLLCTGRVHLKGRLLCVNRFLFRKRIQYLPYSILYNVLSCMMPQKYEIKKILCSSVIILRRCRNCRSFKFNAKISFLKMCRYNVIFEEKNYSY